MATSNAALDQYFDAIFNGNGLEAGPQGQVPAAPHPVPLDEQQQEAQAPETGNGHDGGVSGTVAWGIMGAGRVSHDFVQALKSVVGAEVVAVGASALDKASEFAAKHGIPQAHGSYAALCADPKVQIVYIGTLHAFHKEHALLALAQGKHVLVEKPVACTAADAEAIVKEARARNLLFLEGMWTRFFPAVEAARHLIASGAIGKVVALHADFGFNSSDSEPYPGSPFFQRQLGGGGLLFVGVYPIAMAPFCFGGGMPTRIAAAGVKDEGTGVDLSGGVVLEYAGKGIAVLTYNLMGETPEETTIVGTEGRIKILGPAHCPTRMVVSKKHKGRGNVVEHLVDYPLPPHPASVDAAGGFNYPNSNGFQYEAAAVQRCLARGWGECPQYPAEETLVVARIMDEVRKQLGVKPVGEP